MHSSTSSFERAVPEGRWGATWLAAIAVVVVVVVAFELFVRAHGYRPSIKDDEYSWAWQRGRVSDGSHHTVAVLGTSRILLAFSGDTFAEALPRWRFVQLAIDGSAPIGPLRDLAADPDFRGIALVDVQERHFYRHDWSVADPYIETYHRRYRAVGAMLERRLATAVQSRVALLTTRGVHTFAKLFRSGTWPRPPYTVTHADRTQYADFSLADVARYRNARLQRIEGWNHSTADPESWLADALAVEPAVTAIQARGGNVVYVRMPTCDERWDFDEQTTPKALFWDRLAARTRAITIHFKDYPELARFECPDTSHLDSKDGPAFTRALLEILRARGVFAR